MQQDVPELERRLTELQSQINRLSLSLHLWQERQDRLLEQRLTDWNAIEARAQKDASTRMHELQETIEHEWSALRQVQQDPNQYVRELGSNLGQKLTDLTDQVQAVVTELRANGSLRAQSLQAATPSWPLDDVVRLHNQLRDSPDAHAGGEQALATRASLVLPEAPSELVERLETLERAVSENPLENARSISTPGALPSFYWRSALRVAGVLVSRLQGQVTAATARVSQAEQQAQVATKIGNRADCRRSRRSVTADRPGSRCCRKGADDQRRPCRSGPRSLQPRRRRRHLILQRASAVEPLARARLQ